MYHGTPEVEFLAGILAIDERKDHGFQWDKLGLLLSASSTEMLE